MTREEAIAYLRSKNLYCLDQGTKFKWKSGRDLLTTQEKKEPQKASVHEFKRGAK